jgi:hypothetical protein
MLLIFERYFFTVIEFCKLTNLRQKYVTSFLIISQRNYPHFLLHSLRFGPANVSYFGLDYMFFIQHCFICRPSDSTVSEDAGIKHRTVGRSIRVSIRLDRNIRCPRTVPVWLNNRHIFGSL